MFSLSKKLLFCLPPEAAHHAAVTGIQTLYRLGLCSLIQKPPSHPLTVMGLTFPNHLGLAAGFDKNGDYVEALGQLGFGFIEIGTVTPKPQDGNPKPRLFRLTQEEAIINRMGFNNKGMDHVAKRLSTSTYRGILGINIGKNKTTALENAVDDYVSCFKTLAPFASYITINISSPNTPGLRDLQQEHFLDDLLAALKKEQQLAEPLLKRYVPLVVKISPDLSAEAIKDIAQLFLKHQIDGVIATNTTISRDGVENNDLAKEAGGLSGKPLTLSSTVVLKQLHAILQNRIPIIASGGVMSKQDVQQKLQAGATLVQIYSGLIYRGLPYLFYRD